MFLIKNILSKEECEFLCKQFYIEKESENITEYGFSPFSNYFKIYMDKLKPIISPYIKNDIYNVNTYVREYRNGSELKKHIDRPDIGITLSICLYNDTNLDWKLMANINQTECGYYANVGDGLLLLDSHKIFHWREKLQCEEDKKYIGFFLHWKEFDETHKNRLI